MDGTLSSSFTGHFLNSWPECHKIHSMKCLEVSKSNGYLDGALVDLKHLTMYDIS